MPKHFQTAYAWVAEDLKDLAEELRRIALDTAESITQVESLLFHEHITKILDSLILATRMVRARLVTA